MEYTATKSVGDMFRRFDAILTKLATRRPFTRAMPCAYLLSNMSCLPVWHFLVTV